jgi:hypothetical protein
MFNIDFKTLKRLKPAGAADTLALLAWSFGVIASGPFLPSWFGMPSSLQVLLSVLLILAGTAWVVLRIWRVIGLRIFDSKLMINSDKVPR